MLCAVWGQERLNWHIEKMELMLRLLDNDNLSYEDIKSIQERAVGVLKAQCQCTRRILQS